MNYEAGLLALLLFYVPVYLIYRDCKKKDAEIERKYKIQLEDIERKYGVKE
jgi:cbb3-type cytochrome oxidase subunit 3